MPRYIDVDELIEIERTKLYEEGLRRTPRSYLNLLQNKLEDIETVDAIPIERLEQEIHRYIDLGLNCVAIELRTIVDEWRKENETKIY